MPASADRISAARNGSSTREIAIIGIGCRFPGGADTPEKFWNLLKDGFNAVKEAPPSRSAFTELFDPDPRKPGRLYSRWGGFLERVDQFDAAFFGISPREAVCIDPQHRLLLELVWEACEDAGLAPSRLAGSRTGVFVGISTHDYGDIMMYPWNRSGIDLYSNSGTATSIAANRISYIYDFRGPSFSVDTACSSSLTALHLACQSLRSGDCDLAVVGGVQMLLAPELTIGFCKASMLSRDGLCKAFDASANGYVRGEGGGIVILKPLAAAIADRDPICAVIRSTALNQDGRTPGMTMPAAAAQQAMLEVALEAAGISGRDLQYIEAHGPGTPVGDPIEATAIGSVMARDLADGEKCAIGSVKTNIGHLEAGSGMAGLIKTALALKHRQIPPSLHFHQPSEAIDFDSLHLRVVTSLEPWPQPEKPAIAGLNSFGFGGANAHVILQEGPHSAGAAATEPAESPASAETEVPRLLVLSARSASALKTLAVTTSEYLAAAGGPSLRDVCFSAAQRRDHHEFRVAVVANDKENFAESLAAFAAEENRLNVVSGRASAAPQKLAFVFSGMGPQWWGMGRQLLREERVFRAAIEKCDAALRACSPWSLLDQFSAAEADSRMANPDFAQVSNFAIQAALAELWASWGITPGAVIGHSGGAMAAAYVAGVYSLEDAIRLTYHRSRLQGQPTNEGRMLAVGAPWAEIESLVKQHADRVSLAAVNGPSAITLAGDGEALERIFSALEQRQVFVRFLPVTIAYHSPAMDKIRDEFLASVADLHGRKARIPLMSDSTAQWLDGPECDAAYWWRAIRQPVLFANGITQLLENEVRTFVEVSPHPVLSASIVDCMGAASVTGLTVPSIRRKEDERSVLLRSLGALYAAGYSPNWSGVQREGGEFVKLPGHPWQRERHWFGATAKPNGQSHLLEAPAGSHPTLGVRSRAARPTWESRIGAGSTEYLKEHFVQGSIVFPGAGYVDMALAARAAFDGAPGAQLRDVEFNRPLVFSADRATTVQLALDEDGRFEVFSSAQDDAALWIAHAKGFTAPFTGQEERVDLEALRHQHPRRVPAEDFYAKMAERNLVYGPAFRGIETLWTGHREALGFVHVPGLDVEGYMIHPGLLDSAFQVMAAAVDSDPTLALDRRLFLPVGVKSARLYSKPGGRFWAVAKLTNIGDSTVSTNVRIFSEDGRVCADIRDLTVRLLEANVPGAKETVDQWLYDYRWEPKPRARKSPPLETPVSALAAFPSAEVLADWNRRATENSASCGWQRYYDRAESRLNSLAVAYTFAAFVGPDGALHPRLIAAAKSDDWRARLAQRLLAGLEAEGFVRHSAGDWQLTGKRPDRLIAELREEIVRDYPNHSLDVELLDRCGPHIADVVDGATDGREVLFGRDGFEFLERFYKGSASNAFYNSLAAETAAGLVAASPDGRSLKILEVGAGTGGATSHTLPKLDAARTSYTFTDVSPLFLERARAKFSGHPSLTAKVFDVARDPAAQGFQPGSFDIVIAANVIHATPRLDVTVRHLVDLLAPGGVLLLVEITRPPFWLETIFGLTEGWWKFEDRDRRPHHALLPGAGWQRLLADCGLERASIVADDAPGEPAQSVIIARKPVAVAPPARPAEAAQRWLIFADRAGAGRRLTASLENRGSECTLVFAEKEFAAADADREFSVRPGHAGDFALLAEHLRPRVAQFDGVVHLWSLDAPSPSGAASFEISRTLGCNSVTSILQKIVLGSPLAERSFFLVTSHTQLTDGDSSAPAVLQTPTWGLGRVLLKELPGLRCRLVDLGDRQIGSGDSDTEISSLAEEILSRDPEDADEEIALRSGDRLVHRLRPTSLKHLEDAVPPAAVSAEEAWVADVTAAGSLDGVSLKRVDRRSPGPHEVEVAVHTASLNFRDVVLTMGLVDGLERENSAGKRRLGSDFAGVVSRCGSEVKNFRPGDRVFGLAPASLASHAVTHELLVAHRPDSLDEIAAAGVPLAYVTAWYALRRLARLTRGETLLVHAASGGVGIAALEIARMVGAEVFATAGSPAKRAYLESLGVKHVMDSRTLDFADEVRERTGGRGVDVVLNSLTGEALERGMACLAAYGRFIELGKADIYGAHRLDLSPFRRNLALFSVDLDRLSFDRKELVGEMLREVAEHLASGAIKPQPCTEFEVGRLPEALRFLAQGKHVGKIVIRNAGEIRVRAAVPAQPPIRSDSTYLITGGLGGLGLKIASWLVALGARSLALMGRSRPSLEAEAILSELNALGARVEVIAGDVSLESDVSAAVNFIRANLPPLRGIIHAAMVLEDTPLAELSAESYERVMGPKISGAWNLHVHTRADALDFFVSFSSIASLLGNPQQGNYAAANAFLDEFSAWRRSLGLKATTINWGVISGVGYVARREDIGNYLARQGYMSLAPEQVLEVLSEVLKRDAVRVMAARIDWKLLGETPGPTATSPRFRHLIPTASSAAPAAAGSVRSRIEHEQPAQRPQRVEEYLREQVARLLGTPAAQLDAERAINSMGLDSLIAAELTVVLQRDLGIEISGSKLLAGVSIRGLAAQVLTSMKLESTGPAESSVAAGPVAVAPPAVSAVAPAAAAKAVATAAASAAPSAQSSKPAGSPAAPSSTAAAASGNGAAKSAPPSRERAATAHSTTPQVASAAAARASTAPASSEARSAELKETERLTHAPSGNGSNGHTRRDYSTIDYSRFTRSQTLLRAVTGAGLSVLAAIEAEGLENIPASGPCIIAVNHLSKADTPLFMSKLPRRTVMLANEKYRSSRIINWVISDVGQAIYVTPNALDEHALNDALAVLRAGGLLGLAPEGTRSKTGGLMRARTGAAYLAVAANVPVVPVAAWGQENWRSRMRSLHRIPICVRAGKPLVFPPGPATPQQLLQYTDEIMHALARLLPERYRGVYGAELAASPGALSPAENRRARGVSSST